MEKNYVTFIEKIYKIDFNDTIETYDNQIDYLTALGYYRQQGYTCYCTISEVNKLYCNEVLCYEITYNSYYTYWGTDNDY